MLDKFKTETDIPDDDISDAISDLIAETFPQLEQDADTAIVEPETGEGTTADSATEDTTDEEPEELEDLLEQAQDKLDALKKELVTARLQIADLDSETEALQEKQSQEIAVMTEAWQDSKKALSSHLKPLKAEHKTAMKALAAEQKEKKKKLQAQIKALEKAIPNADTELKMLSNKGKLELILADPELIGTLKDRWMDAEVAKRLDYPIFMAVSERGGKNNSGEYDYMIDSEGNLVEFPDGHPQAGHPKVDQDLVNYDLSGSDLDSKTDTHNDLCIAEYFIRFAQEQQFDFWGAD
jgi:type I restriction enzyme M protein